MNLSHNLLERLIETRCEGKDIGQAERRSLVRLTGIAMNSINDPGSDPEEVCIHFVHELQNLCNAIADEKDRIRKDLEHQIEKAKERRGADITEAMDAIKAVANSDPKIIRRILTAIINCERSSVPEEFQGEFAQLQQALGLTKILDD
ncbi:hypothetical protein [Maridesulfovibrio sp.]|uniref:hypothetical protein n=1 Tax=Maridesulfovibrio sp. TaxID=2795000 RepID=UPI0029F49A97|nr:hypothetical protein [Maridesulfovibrio sp.]